MATRNKTLLRHVRESNAIEGIDAGSGDPLFDRHVEAVALVETNAQKGVLTMPLDIHRILLPDMTGYRTHDVYISGVMRNMPPHHMVPALMEMFLRTYTRWHAHAVLPPKSQPYQKQWVTERAWVLNHWFLCIHPFADGNGRTARLIVNSFLRSAGFHWHVVQCKNKQHYYKRIREFEEKVFYTWHPPEQWKY